MEGQPGFRHSATPVPVGDGWFGGRVMPYVRSGMVLYWLSFFILILIEFFLGGQLSKMLTKENYSIYINVLNTLPFYNIVVNAGLAYGITYIVSYNRRIGFSVFRQSTVLQAAWYLALAAVHLLIFFFYRGLFVTSLLITILISFAYAYKLNLSSLFLATGSYTKAALSNILQKVALVAVFVFVFYHGTLRDVLNGNFVPVYPLTELSVVLLYFIVFRRTNYLSFSALNVNYRKRLLRYGKYAMVNNGLNVLYYTIFAFIIRSSGVALHMQIILGLCIMFFRYTAVAVAPVFATMNPRITAVKNEAAKVRKMYGRYFVFTLLVGTATLAGCLLFFGDIISRFYAAAYSDLPAFFYFFCYLIPLLFLNSLNGSVLAALGRIKYTTLTEVICTLVLVFFLVYNVVKPITDYRVFYYMVVTHLAIKFLLLEYGVLTSVKRSRI